MGSELLSDKLHALEFSMTIGCRLACKYCPQDKLLKEYAAKSGSGKHVFSLEDFKTCLDKVQQGAGISFCGMSEPFHNPQCADMIRYAYDRGYKISLLTTLVGMTEDDFEKIKDINFDSVILHIPDEENNSQFRIDQKYLKLLKLVNEHIKIEYYSCHGTVHHSVKNILDPEKYVGISVHDRAGILELEGYKKWGHEGRIVCFSGSETQVSGWAPVVLPDGTLLLCCQDYEMKHILGNLIQQSWDEIKEGEEYKKFETGLEDDTIPLICRKCNYARSIDKLPSMKIKKLVEENKRDHLNQKEDDPVYKLSEADNICIFGLGKLFRDHYFKYHYHELLKPAVFSDNNPDMWGIGIQGVECVPPDTLSDYKNILVVLFVKNDSEIRKQLSRLGIDNFINAYELFWYFNK